MLGSYATQASSACLFMALKCLERPPRRLLQQCYSTFNPQPRPNFVPSRRSGALNSASSLPSSTKFFASASLAPHLTWRSAYCRPLSIRALQHHPKRCFSYSAIRSATPQEAHGSNITASYIASAGELELVDVKKVLVIGSGGLSIGQAGEFDYSGMGESAVIIMS